MFLIIMCAGGMVGEEGVRLIPMVNVTHMYTQPICVMIFCGEKGNGFEIILKQHCLQRQNKLIIPSKQFFVSRAITATGLLCIAVYFYFRFGVFIMTWFGPDRNYSDAISITP